MKRSLKGNDVVFMYPPVKADLFAEYQASILAWGGAHKPEAVRILRKKKIHSTGTVWCLTAGAKVLHKNKPLREKGVCRDVAGLPIPVPWLFDQSHKKIPAYFGCTNSPAYRKHLHALVRKVMKAGADGLHVDDPLGSAQTVQAMAGCYCEHCVMGFRKHLADLQRNNEEMRKLARADLFEKFNYRDFAAHFGATAADYLQHQNEDPLHEKFHDWQLARSTANLEELRAVAARAAKHPVTLSSNTCLPELRFLPLTRACDYLVAENDQHSEHGTRRLHETILAYRMADALRKPMAATARGQDWSLVKALHRENLVLFWIALAYANGQRFMAPHRQWCYTETRGTHWYDAPSATFAAVYRFISDHGKLFNNLHTAGPLAVPDLSKAPLDTAADRAAFHERLTQGDPRPLICGAFYLFPRESEEGDHAVVHVLNRYYTPESDSFASLSRPAIQIPLETFKGVYRNARVITPDGESTDLTLTRTPDLRLVLPHSPIWQLVELTL